jgi:methylmalonyl-CoA mutase, N-terminal domain
LKDGPSGGASADRRRSDDLTGAVEGESGRHGSLFEGHAARTDSAIPVRTVFVADDVEGGLDALTRRLGQPGEPPFTRGAYRAMYRERLWTMRQFAGFGSAEETNERFRLLLHHGQTALSVAFDLPTQLGYDSDHELAAAEIGRVGVAIDTAEDMELVFRDLPLDEVSVNFTINATAPIILAMYLVAAERQGVAHSQLTGTLQNDILKEFLARKLFVYPPAHSMRLVVDVVEFATRELPRFNPISITGYHAREAGCDAVQELGLTMSDAIAYSDAIIARGIDFDVFAPRLSFHFATSLDLFEEVAKLRAARRLWHSIATERFGARKPSSSRLRFFSGCSGATLTAQQPLNNIVRSTIQCLGAVLGGAQSIHVMGYDEAYELPNEEAAILALRTQQVIALESGVARTADPLAGSFYVEWLTDEVERRAREVIAEIDSAGGAVAATQAGVPQRWIAESAYRYEVEVSSGARPKVGVNVHSGTGTAEPRRRGQGATLSPEVAEGQLARLAAHKARRDVAAANRALLVLSEAVKLGDNVMPALVHCARAGATLGEMSEVMTRQFGRFEEPVAW